MLNGEMRQRRELEKREEREIGKRKRFHLRDRRTPGTHHLEGRGALSFLVKLSRTNRMSLVRCGSVHSSPTRLLNTRIHLSPPMLSGLHSICDSRATKMRYCIYTRGTRSTSTSPETKISQSWPLVSLLFVLPRLVEKQLSTATGSLQLDQLPSTR